MIVGRIFSICPRISRESGCLVARTAWRVRILLFGSYIRTVSVDPYKKLVTVHGRWLWFITKRRIVRFDRIRAVIYGHQDISIAALWSWAHDSSDEFFVHLHLHGGQEIRLFSFVGSGQFVNDGPMPDWYYWQEYMTDVVGTQEDESRRYAELVAAMTGTEVTAPGILFD
jgi:hypothetical protein